MPRVILPDGSTHEMGDGQSVATPVSIPGLSEAIAKENESRDLAFLALGDESGMFYDTIAGVRVSALTLRHVLWLTTARSVFVTGEPLTEDNLTTELVKFLRIVRVPERLRWWQRKPKPAAENEAITRQMFKAKATAEDALNEIREYLNAAFADAPGGSGDKKKYYSSAAEFCCFMCGKYGVTLERAMDVPLSVAFQLMKCARRSNDPKAILFNPSDELVSRHLQTKN